MNFQFFFGLLLITGVTDYLFVVGINGFLNIFKYQKEPVEIWFAPRESKK